MTPPPTILVLHGALGAAEQMRPVADALGELGPVRLVEFAGHGATPLGEGAFGIAGFRDALAASLDASPPYVFGYSMGGYVALALEAARPGSVAGIVTLGTKFDWTPEVAAREAARLDAATIREKVPRFAAALEARHAHAGGWELVLERTAGLLRDLGADPLLDASSLARVRCPVVIAVGGRDDTVSVDECQATAAWLPHAAVESLADLPHPIEKVPPASAVALMRALMRMPVRAPTHAP